MAIKRNLNPVWPLLRMNMNKICKRNPKSIIKVECRSYKNDIEDVLIGEFYTNWANLSSFGRLNFQLNLKGK